MNTDHQPPTPTVTLTPPPRLKDGYLLENCLAVLVNLAPQAEHLQPYAAERLVTVLVAASRRWIEGANSAAAAAAAAAAASASDNVDANATADGAASGSGNTSANANTSADANGHAEASDQMEISAAGLSDVQVSRRRA